MSGVFKSLKDLFVESDGTSQKEIRPGNKAEGDASISNKKTVSVPLSSNMPIGGEVNEKFLGVLFEALEENNLDGFDYLEYKKSLQYLKKMNMDDKTRYQSAFASARTMGVTRDQLLQTANEYLNVLTKENQKFEAAWKAQSEKQIVEVQNEQVQLQKDLESKKQMIARLKQEIEESEQRLEAIEGQLEDAGIKVTKTKNDFDKSYIYLVEQIKNDVSKMKLYLE